MDKIPCQRCKEPRELGEYRIWPKSGNRAKTCEPCLKGNRNRTRREKGQRDGITESGHYRQQNPEKVAALRRKYRTRNLNHVMLIKSKSVCADCGLQYPPVCMDFDHTGSDKVRDISVLVTQGASIAAIDAEIAKCELVCANCHRIRTARRGDWFAGDNYDVDGRVWAVIAQNDLPTVDLYPVSSCR
jgi:hypothetical protein